jgi:hypothetical protein
MLRVLYAFSPESTIPSMKYLWPTKYRTTGGAIAIVHAAMMDFQSVPNPDRKLARACGCSSRLA